MGQANAYDCVRKGAGGLILVIFVRTYYVDDPYLLVYFRLTSTVSICEKKQTNTFEVIDDRRVKQG